MAGTGDDAALGRAGGDDARIAGVYGTEGVAGLSDAARIGGSSQRGDGVAGRGDDAQIAGATGDSEIEGARGDAGNIGGLNDQAGLAGASGESSLAGISDAAAINGSWQTTTLAGGKDSADIAIGYFALSCQTDRESGSFVFQNIRQLQLDVFDGNILTQYQNTPGVRR